MQEKFENEKKERSIKKNIYIFQYIFLFLDFFRVSFSAVALLSSSVAALSRNASRVVTLPTPFFVLIVTVLETK